MHWKITKVYGTYKQVWIWSYIGTSVVPLKTGITFRLEVGSVLGFTIGNQPISELHCYDFIQCILVFFSIDFIFSAEILPKISSNPDLPVECIGSWSCWYGQQDQVGLFFSEWKWHYFTQMTYFSDSCTIFPIFCTFLPSYRNMLHNDNLLYFHFTLLSLGVVGKLRALAENLVYIPYCVELILSIYFQCISGGTMVVSQRLVKPIKKWVILNGTGIWGGNVVKCFWLAKTSCFLSSHFGTLPYLERAVAFMNCGPIIWEYWHLGYI